MDIFIGLADGRKICYNLKNSPEFYNIPVILFSSSLRGRSTIRDTGADDFICKQQEDKLLT